ncbi:DUF2502 domain-containing protein [Pantoea sp. A4]|uniref:DUF2502 domain-containing protein n=1 Tax=Pantoea sp. A4 TaxID=1225184 RepID=UPI0003822882|nr:DUF2502 domain-containing protein [Pantoea sp. A4]
MKRQMLFAAVLAALTLSPLAVHTAQANGAYIQLAPGVSLHLGDRNPRGDYWDGGRWRDARWWHNNYRYGENRWWRHEEWRRHRAWERDHRRHDHGRWHHGPPPPPPRW